MIANVIGASGSGKTSLIACLLGEHPDKYRKLIPYTSRAKRALEQDGVDYHFVAKSFFFGDCNFVLQRKRDDGIYGVNELDLESSDEKILLTTFPPKGVLRLEELGFRVKCFHLFASIEECKKRMLGRGDSITEVENRLLIDQKESSPEVIKNILPTHSIFLLDGSSSTKELASILHQCLLS